MHNFMFIFVSLVFTNILFASTNPKEVIPENTNMVSIELSEEEIFIQDSEKKIKELLSLKKIPNSSLSKSSIRSYYKSFDNQLIWSNQNGIKDISISLLETIKNDPVLKPNAKNTFKLNEMLLQLNSLEKTNDKYIESMAKIDFMLTSIYDKYMRYLSRGYINWKGFKKELKQLDKKEEISADWEKHNAHKNTKKLLKKAILANNLELAFNEVNFTYPKSKELAQKLNDLEYLAKQGGYIKLPKFKTLREGDVSPIVEILRNRLLQSNDLKTDNCAIGDSNLKEINSTPLVVNKDNCYINFDETLKEAVISFQKSHGLKPDGIVGAGTRKHLNISVESKIEKIRLNLERMRWLPRTLGDKYLLVNIPDYKLKMYENNEVKLDMKVVVGTRKNPTPIFSDKMSFVVLNPYWRIPPSIVKKELIPKLLKNPTYLHGKGINLHENWDQNSKKFDLDSIDWSLYDESRISRTNITNSIIDGEEVQTEESVEPLKGPTMRFIQIPSNSNPLGRMKFMFPNKYAVYLHDTPAKRYFNYTNRALSHGCIRLSEPKELLKVIASEDKNLDYTKASNILSDIEKKQIGLNKKIPVHMVYLTSWVDENNKLQFRDDIYKYDRIQRKFL